MIANMEANKKETFLFLVNNTILPSDSPLIFWKKLKWLLVRKSKQWITKLSKTKLNETVKASALSSGNLGKSEFLAGEDTLLKKTCYKKLLQPEDLSFHH